jgi:hypothetical protein
VSSARRFLACVVLAGVLVIGVAMGASGEATACTPTLSDGGGPWSTTGIVAPRRAKIGTGHALNGRVLRAGDCASVRGALVVFWQAGPNGYTSRGRGSVRTDRRGRFRFEGPVPASYGREPHIHIAVIHPDYEELLTRYVVPRGERSGRIRIVLTPLL